MEVSSCLILLVLKYNNFKLYHSFSPDAKCRNVKFIKNDNKSNNNTADGLLKINRQIQLFGMSDTVHLLCNAKAVVYFSALVNFKFKQIQMLI